VEINYIDSRNKEISETKILILKTYTEKQAVDLGLIEKNNTGILIIFIVVLVVLYIIYRKINKARKRKRQEKEG
jgi:flagellar biosynthesis/type III secretory pathway M-ring protein FliF/YscJ